MSRIDVAAKDVRAGDMAEHRGGHLDPRLVAKVDHEAGSVCLWLGPHASAPLPMRNYRFTRSHPIVAHPRIPVSTLPDGRHEATCQHCPWTKATNATTKAEIELDVKHHRWQHRQGLIEVTPRG
ncbi:hypothetical protein CWIS_13735 [Cellulomonas sp. A375-1]|uniref:hypothetical protein n=1 Tax=Cellulomonas sp. A375-1 TaxID=1672219 RepID=UPI0006527E0C|nr:hypothetical protein [Cellulomonas sp. A375-1]KMM44878.1 hypothetical protein CWIS_13735 [Cellulomonas sp. A375-1]